MDSNLCNNCKISKTDLKKFSCEHELCPNCLCLLLLKNEFNFVKEKIIFICPLCIVMTDKGKLELTKEEIEKVFEIKKANNDSLICPKHNKPCNNFCAVCNKELCDECSKIDSEHKEGQLNLEIAFDEYKNKAYNNLFIKKYEIIEKILNQNKKKIQDENDNAKNNLKNFVNDMKKTLDEIDKNIDECSVNNEKYLNNLIDIMIVSYKKFYNICESKSTPVNIFNEISTMKNLKNLCLIPNKEKLNLCENLLKKINEYKEDISKFKLNLNYKMEFQEGFIQTGNFETIKFDYTEFMSGADFYNDFNYIVSSSTDHILKIYKSQNNEILKEYSEIESISDNKSSVWSFLDFNEEYFITGNFDGLIKFWSKERYETDIILSGHTKKVNKLLKFDKNTLLSCSDDSTIKIWSVNDKECVASLTDHEGKVNDIIIIDENHILSCSEDRTLRLWNLENVECVQVVSTKNIENCLCKLSDDKILVGGKDNYIKIYDIDLEYVDMFKAHDDEVLVIKENKNGDIISGGKEHLVKIFNANSLECKKVLQGHNNSIINIYEKDDKIISASVDRTIKIWTI